MADTSEGSLDGQRVTDKRDGRLAAYVARSQTPLDGPTLADVAQRLARVEELLLSSR
jgi:hypothetical protein